MYGYKAHAGGLKSNKKGVCYSHDICVMIGPVYFTGRSQLWASGFMIVGDVDPFLLW